MKVYVLYKLEDCGENDAVFGGVRGEKYILYDLEGKKKASGFGLQALGKIGLSAEEKAGNDGGRRSVETGPQ